MDYRDIRVAREDGIGTLSFHRPDKGNAVHPAMLREVCDALDDLAADPAVRAIVLRGEGKNFSAGADLGWLDELPSTPPATVQSSIYEHFQGAARRLYRCRKPTVAAVRGAAVTVGCELALACDFRIVSDSGLFQESWIRLGLMPPLGGLFLLPRLIGLQRAAQMALRGEAVKADRAVEIGLALEKVAEEELEPRARALAAELAALPPIAYASVKEALQRGLETSMDAEWSTNVAKQAILLSTEDFREGLGAVKERRKPSFAGR